MRYIVAQLYGAASVVGVHKLRFVTRNIHITILQLLQTR
jgi:hypothetical protein